MTMRVIECNVCGEPLAAASDDELVKRLRAHLKTEHASELDEHQARLQIANEAYDATDS